MHDPTDSTSFLFTDVERSAAIWEAAPEAMSIALARHDELVRRSIDECGGTVFKTVGDAFYAVFTSPRPAAEAAITVQRRLISEPWPQAASLRIRVAIHSGCAELRCDDYFGPTLNRVARLVGIAHGRQILLSGRAAALVLFDVPANTNLVDLGEHRLRDLTGLERVFQLCADGLPRSFPPLRRSSLSAGVV